MKKKFQVKKVKMNKMKNKTNKKFKIAKKRSRNNRLL